MYIVLFLYHMLSLLKRNEGCGNLTGHLSSIVIVIIACMPLCVFVMSHPFLLLFKFVCVCIVGCTVME